MFYPCRRLWGLYYVFQGYPFLGGNLRVRQFLQGFPSYSYEAVREGQYRSGVCAKTVYGSYVCS